MASALKAALQRIGTLLLAAVAGGAVQPAQVAQAALDTGEQAPGPGEQEVWAEATRVDTAMAYQRYLELYPMGLHMEEAFRRIVERSLTRPRPGRLVEIEPALGPPGGSPGVAIAAADLSLY